MHHSTKRRVVLGMTTGGLVIGGLGMGIAQADTAATGAAANSPGLLSGNLIQVPVNAPVNVCGDSISVVGILDSATGDRCSDGGSNGATASGSDRNSGGVGSGNLIEIPINAPVNLCGDSISGVGVGDSASDDTCTNGGSGSAGGTGAGATGGSTNSPGVGAGNTVQVPVTAPIDACGDSISVIGILDSAAGDTCSNAPSAPSHPAPPTCSCHQTPPAHAKPHTPPRHRAPASSASTGALAETGTGAGQLATPLGASMLGGGGLLLRKRMAGLQNLIGSKH